MKSNIPPIAQNANPIVTLLFILSALTYVMLIIAVLTKQYL